MVASTINSSPLDGVSFIAKHQYMVTDVNFATNRIYLRNPWGYDGTSVTRNSNPFDGTVLFTPQEFFL